MGDLSTVYKKSNFIISSKYKASLMENKLIAIATSRLTIKDDCPYAMITMSEVKKFLGVDKDNKNIYKQVKRYVKSLVSHPVIIEDYDTSIGKNDNSIKGNIIAMSMITTAKYTNGKIEIFFNRDFVPLMMNLKNNFTLLELQTLMKFEKDYTFRLYEILRKEIYKIKNDGVISVYYGLSELKCLIGLIDINQPSVRIAIESGKSWDYIVNELKVEKSFKAWGDFRRDVIEVAMEEINEKTDISFTFEPHPSGKGNKYIGITFYIKKNTTNYGQNNHQEMKSSISDHSNETNLTDYDQKVEELVVYLENSITFDQSYELFRCASYDEVVVKKAYDYSKEQKYIENFMGWMKWCIKNKAYETEKIPVIEGSVSKGKEVVEIMNDYNENKDEYSKMAWEKTKDRDDFETFLKYYDLEVEMLELTKPYEECIRLYVDWKLKR